MDSTMPDLGFAPDEAQSLQGEGGGAAVAEQEPPASTGPVATITAMPNLGLDPDEADRLQEQTRSASIQ